jgi:SAM-dependent methyltransferase
MGPLAFRCQAILSAGHEHPIHSCAACGASFFWPLPSAEEIARCYPHTYFRDFFKQFWKDYYKGRALARTISRWKKSGRFLDVGCALGTMLAGVRDHSSWEVAGLEYSPAAAEMGRALNHLEIAVGGLTQAPWDSASWDYIFGNNVLEHEADPAGFAAAAARLLRPAGRLHLTLPNGPVDLLTTEILYRRWRRPVATRHRGHLFFFTQKTLKSLLERAGLKVLWIKNFHFKTALKARGWTPGAFRPFAPAPSIPSPDPEEASLEEYRRLIPPRPSWPVYWLSQKVRRLWRLPRLAWGYDFEVLAEKV